MSPLAAWPVVVVLGAPVADVALPAGVVVLLDEVVLLQAAVSSATADRPTAS
jgi:hypothetical protein